MKKLMFLLSVAAMFATTSCTKEPATGIDTGAGEVSVTFDASLQDIASRAVGDGSLAKNLTVLVYDKNGKFVAKEGATMDEHLHATVHLSLVKNETYAFAFWAQADAAPFTLNEEAGTVTVNYAEANNEKGDAFFYYRAPASVDSAVVESISLKRPFAQVNIGTNDFATVKSHYGDDAFENAISSLKISGVYSTLDLRGGAVVGDSATVDFAAAEIPNGTFKMFTTDYDYLCMNYVLVGTDKSLVDVECNVSGIKNCAAKTISLTGVPVQRNYRTNIAGAMLTFGKNFDVTIEPQFVYDEPFQGDIMDLNEAFAAGVVNGKVFTAPYADAYIFLPKTDAAVSIELPITDKTITIKYAYAAEANQKPATLSITAPSTDNLVLELPETTVTLNGEIYKEVSATTADNTLIVAAGTTVQKLNVLKGNVEVYGNVVEFVKAAGVVSTYTLHIATAERLAELATEVNKGACNYDIVMLDNDIDLENKAWTPIGTSSNVFTKIFDGQNHTISNLTINRPYVENVGLFGVTQEGEVKNLTINNATVTGNLDVGVVAGTPYTTKYTNIKVTGLVKVNGRSYVGGMFGKNAYANLTDLTIDVDEGSFVKVASGASGRSYVGGIVGFMGEGAQVVSDVQSNIDVIGSTCDVGGITGMAHYGNTFRNCVCTGNVTLENAPEAGYELEIGGIAGVWHDQTGKTVTFTNCSFTGTLKTALNGVDKSADVAESNKITGRRYGVGTGKLIIDGVEITE